MPWIEPVPDLIIVGKPRQPLRRRKGNASGEFDWRYAGLQFAGESLDDRQRVITQQYGRDVCRGFHLAIPPANENLFQIALRGAKRLDYFDGMMPVRVL